MSFVILFLLLHSCPILFPFFFFNDTATTEIYTLSLHDALPISYPPLQCAEVPSFPMMRIVVFFSLLSGAISQLAQGRSEEHTSELQSRLHLVCRLLLEKKKKQTNK